MELKAVDIVGCSSGAGTRTCTTHEVCGESILLNDVVVFRLEVVHSYSAMFDGSDAEQEGLCEVLKVYRIVGTEQRCHVGFLPQRYLKRKTIFNGKTALITEDYRTTYSKSRRERSNRHKGVVKAVLLEHIAEFHRSG